MAKRLLIATVALLAVFGPVIGLTAPNPTPHFLSAGLALTLSLSSIVGGYIANRWAFGRSPKVFMATLVGGMVARIAFIAILLVWVVTHLRIPLITFFICLAVSYLVYQVVEVWTVNRELKKISA